MWLPKDTADLEQQVTFGTLEETDTFDAKEVLPSNKETAKDIAAMSTDGGVLVYGVREDENGNPTELNPIELQGTPERIVNITQTSIQETPTIRTHIFRSESDPATGYIVVHVPMSARAPHMVIVGGDRRFYGRADKRNVILGEGEVARLYARRERWDTDAGSILSGAMQRAPIEPHSDVAYLHVVLQPLSAPDDVLLQLGGRPQDSLPTLIQDAASPAVFDYRYSPDYTWPKRVRHTLRGFVAEMSATSDHERESARILDLHIGNDGSLYLFCGRAADKWNGNDLRLFEAIIAGLLTRTLFLGGVILGKVGYLGPVDVGICVTGMQGAYSDQARRYPFELRAIEDDEYRRTMRVQSYELEDALYRIASDLYMPLVRVTTQRDNDPWGR